MAEGNGRGSSATEFAGLAERPSRDVEVVASATKKKRARAAAPAAKPDTRLRKSSLPRVLQPQPISPALTLPFRVGLNYFAAFLPGGRETMMDLARLADRENIRNVATLYEGLNQLQRGKVVIEELCRSAEVSPVDFISAVTAVAYTVNMDISRLLASLAQPEVIGAAVERAKDVDGGHADRKMLLQAQGFLPVGGNINVTQKTVAVAGANAQANAEASGPSFDEVLRQSAEVVRR